MKFLKVAIYSALPITAFVIVFRDYLTGHLMGNAVILAAYILGLSAKWRWKQIDR